MGYAKITNLYKCADIQMFKECWAMEKIDGSSCSITATINQAGDLVHTYLTGGESQTRVETIFAGCALYDMETVKQILEQWNAESVTVFGEIYGGSHRKQSWRYGPTMKFVGFDVEFLSNSGKTFFVNVPIAHDFCSKVGLDFVHYVKVTTETEVLNAERDAKSEQAIRNGVVDSDKPREGVVLRPLVEVLYSTGERVVAKHKRDAERETATPREVGKDLVVLEQAQQIADEWVTETRLQHVLSKLPPGIGVEKTGDVVRAMTSDIFLEGVGEVVDSREARVAIAKLTATLFKKHSAKPLAREISSDVHPLTGVLRLGADGRAVVLRYAVGTPHSEIATKDVVEQKAAEQKAAEQKES